MNLIYRSNTYTQTPAETNLYCKPNAINWRYQAPGETCGQDYEPTSIYRQPHTLNRRYQSG
jgi:hypothetical protein